MLVLITFVMASLFFQIQALKFCPCNLDSTSLADKSSESSWCVRSIRSNPACLHISSNLRQHLLFIFQSAQSRHAWKSRVLDAKKAANITITVYRTFTTPVSSNIYWLPVPGCDKVPLSKGECFPVKCHDEEYFKVLLHSGNQVWLYRAEFANQCDSRSCHRDHTPTTTLPFVKKKTADAEISKCYFMLAEEAVEEHNGTSLQYSDFNNFQANAYDLSIQSFYQYQNIIEHYMLDKIRCEFHSCKPIMKLLSELGKRKNGQKNSLICFKWMNAKNGQVDRIRCVQPISDLLKFKAFISYLAAL